MHAKLEEKEEMKRGKGRVVFYTKKDLTIGENILKAESILMNFIPNENRDINDILELYHVKLFIDNDIFLNSWNDDVRKRHLETTKKMWEEITQYWQGIDEGSIQETVGMLEYDYQSGFWDITEKLKAFKRISKKSFQEILSSDRHLISIILQHKKLAAYFGEEIKSYLLTQSDSAELLLSQFEQHHDQEVKDLYFPKCISENDIEQIILNYLSQDKPNLNYVRLITRAKDDQLKLKPRTKLRANKLEKELNSRILDEGTPIKYGTQVSISHDQTEPIIEKRKGTRLEVSYSAYWIKKLCAHYSLSPLFTMLFKYLDNGCITLVSKPGELDPLEAVFMRSKNDYVTGGYFNLKNHLSYLQLLSLREFLEESGGSLESNILDNVEKHLNKNLGIKNCKLSLPSVNSSFLEKVRLLVPEIESILKQYKTYVEEKVIDHELLQLNSRTVSFSNIPSLVSKKYVYGKGKEFDTLSYLFFSQESPLCYFKSFGNKYKHFYSILMNEDVSISCFEKYQIDALEYLIQKGQLFVDPGKVVRLKNEPQKLIIGILDLHEVINYWHFPKEHRKAIDSMENDGLLAFKSTLFSEPECKYFNFYLNKAEFTNGFDLRNKYAHGTNKSDKKAHENDYYLLMRLLILVLLKIEDDLLCLGAMKKSKT